MHPFIACSQVSYIHCVPTGSQCMTLKRRLAAATFAVVTSYLGDRLGVSHIMSRNL